HGRRAAGERDDRDPDPHRLRPRPELQEGGGHRHRDGAGLHHRGADRRLLPPARRGGRRGAHRAGHLRPGFARPPLRAAGLPGGTLMSPRPFVALVAALLLGPALAAGATSEECPRWREAFAGMPTRMVTIQAGAKTLALRVKSADSTE